ncbi:hypothetical protein DVH24_003238 [Malus domestica]|uniref:Uncharacterized protein n=1 Tax=Malus domestica TaxID=3750 RepID=A0A498IHT4_MALDO|nr:hypothetical protein DVH24_003238 [Malus domestica]
MNSSTPPFRDFTNLVLHSHAELHHQPFVILVVTSWRHPHQTHIVASSSISLQWWNQRLEEGLGQGERRWRKEDRSKKKA